MNRIKIVSNRRVAIILILLLLATSVRPSDRIPRGSFLVVPAQRPYQDEYDRLKYGLPLDFDFEVFIHHPNHITLIRKVDDNLFGKRNEKVFVKKVDPDLTKVVELLIREIVNIPAIKEANGTYSENSVIVEYSGKALEGKRVKSSSPISAFVRNSQNVILEFSDWFFKSKGDTRDLDMFLIQSEANRLLFQLVSQKAKDKQQQFH